MSQELNTEKMMTSKTYSLDEIKQIAPSVFTTDKLSTLTDKYIHAPTSRVIEDLMGLGWEITKCQEVRSKKYKGFQKHAVVLRHPDIQIKGKDGDDSFPQVILTNSHDGKNAFNFRVGIYRLVCSNGLVVADSEFGNMSIRHVNYTFDNLREKMNELISKLPGLVQKINLFKNTKLTESQMVEFANKAAMLRTKQRVNALELLEATRSEDQGNGLWETYNRIQEKILGGSYTAGKRKARSVKSFQKDIEINEKLWELAESYVG
jgi:hypothetical protein